MWAILETETRAEVFMSPCKYVYMKNSEERQHQNITHISFALLLCSK